LIKVQIVEINQNLRALLAWHLQQQGYHIHSSGSLRQAEINYLNFQPDLIILEPDLPDGNGIEWCQRLKEAGSTLVLILSAKNRETDVVKALYAGADDYLKKPFGMQEFLARITALTRRLKQPQLLSTIHHGELEINLIQRKVKFRQEYIDLTPQEFSLLYVLVQAQGRPLSRNDLLKRAWDEKIDNQRTVDTHILTLRKKLSSELIETIRGVGYCLLSQQLDQV
jgi:two-component system OmpR family response regulator